MTHRLVKKRAPARPKLDKALALNGVRWESAIVERALEFWLTIPEMWRPAPAEPFAAWWQRKTQPPIEADEAPTAKPVVPVTEQRQPVYGHPALNFSRQALSWTGKLANKLTSPITPQDVAILMADVKLCRLIESPAHEDSLLDVGGYMSCLEQVNAVAVAGTDGSGIRSETMAEAVAIGAPIGLKG